VSVKKTAFMNDFPKISKEKREKINNDLGKTLAQSQKMLMILVSLLNKQTYMKKNQWN